MTASEKEIAAVKELRGMIPDLLELMTPYQSHNMSLLRFLRARELDVDKAVTMLRKHWEWRIQNDIGNILEIKLPKLFENNYPVKVCGFAKDGYPVVLGHAGVWDFKGAMEMGLKDQFVLYIEKFFEQATKFCEVYSTPDKFISQAYVIIDAGGFQARQMTSRDVIATVVKLIRIFEGNYPELLRMAIVINVPTIFLMSWKLIRNLLTQRTVSKIRILGSKQEWQTQIFDIIDPDNWPSEYGGAITTCIDYKFCYGFDVFPTYESFSSEEFKTVTIESRKKFLVDLIVEEGSILSWNFKTELYDISFGVNFEKGEPLVKKCRVDSHLYLQKGMIKCSQSGRYTLIFDNTYSSFREKRITYAFRNTKNPTEEINSTPNPPSTRKILGQI